MGKYLKIMGFALVVGFWVLTGCGGQRTSQIAFNLRDIEKIVIDRWWADEIIIDATSDAEKISAWVRYFASLRLLECEERRLTATRPGYVIEFHNTNGEVGIIQYNFTTLEFNGRFYHIITDCENRSENIDELIYGRRFDMPNCSATSAQEELPVEMMNLSLPMQIINGDFSSIVNLENNETSIGQKEGY